MADLSEMSVITYKIAKCHNPENLNLNLPLPMETSNLTREGVSELVGKLLGQ
jgi:hypothetical protein